MGGLNSPRRFLGGGLLGNEFHQIFFLRLGARILSLDPRLGGSQPNPPPPRGWGSGPVGYPPERGFFIFSTLILDPKVGPPTPLPQGWVQTPGSLNGSLAGCHGRQSGGILEPTGCVFGMGSVSERNGYFQDQIIWVSQSKDSKTQRLPREMCLPGHCHRLSNFFLPMFGIFFCHIVVFCFFQVFFCVCIIFF